MVAITQKAKGITSYGKLKIGSLILLAGFCLIQMLATNDELTNLTVGQIIGQDDMAQRDCAKRQDTRPLYFGRAPHYDVKELPPASSEKTFFTYCPSVKRAFKVLGWKEMAKQDQARYVFEPKKYLLDHQKLNKGQRATSAGAAERIMNDKLSLLKGIKTYEKTNGKKIDFLPETYDLSDEKMVKQFLGRTDPSTKASTLVEHRGCDKPWVLKERDEDNGKGVVIIGPKSQKLDSLRKYLLKRGTFANRIVQEYIQDEMTWEYDGGNYKFDLRTFMLVASARPLIVFFGQGYVRRGGLYLEQNFNSSRKHLTNVGQNTDYSHVYTLENDSVGLWDSLREQVEHHVELRPWLHHISNPMQHIENQMKHAMATAMDAFRTDWDHLDSTDTENGFVLMGVDFIIGSNLKVWLTEFQSGPGIGHEEHPNRILFHDNLFSAVIQTVEHVMEEQFAGKTLLPVPPHKLGHLELIYTDNEMFQYDSICKK